MTLEAEPQAIKQGHREGVRGRTEMGAGAADGQPQAHQTGQVTNPWGQCGQPTEVTKNQGTTQGGDASGGGSFQARPGNHTSICVSSFLPLPFFLSFLFLCALL